VGLAYSRFLTSRVTIDASMLYMFRTENDDFKVGDRFDVGAALAYRLTESINKALDEAYKSEGREKPFSTAMIGKLIIE
jgi:hypothetical protein